MLSPVEFVDFYAQVGAKKSANSAGRLFLAALLAGFLIASGAVAASTVWLWLMNPGYGLLNTMLNAVGLPSATWLSHSSSALFSVTLVTVWQGVGANMVIFLAALQNMPAQV